MGTRHTWSRTLGATAVRGEQPRGGPFLCRLQSGFLLRWSRWAMGTATCAQTGESLGSAAGGPRLACTNSSLDAGTLQLR